MQLSQNWFNCTCHIYAKATKVIVIDRNVCLIMVTAFWGDIQPIGRSLFQVIAHSGMDRTVAGWIKECV